MHIVYLDFSGWEKVIELAVDMHIVYFDFSGMNDAIWQGFKPTAREMIEAGTMVRIAIVDPHELIRRGWKNLLAGREEEFVCCEASTARELMQLLRSEKCDLIVLGLALPDRCGLDVLEDIRRHYPGIPVLIVSMYGEEQFAMRALRRGASGYLSKTSSGPRLVKAVETIVSGGTFFSPEMTELLTKSIQEHRTETEIDSLTDREFQVLLLIASGLPVKAIAERLLISEKTVRNHRSSILKRLNLQNDAELTRCAIKSGLISLAPADSPES